MTDKQKAWRNALLFVGELLLAFCLGCLTGWEYAKIQIRDAFKAALDDKPMQDLLKRAAEDARRRK